VSRRTGTPFVAALGVDDLLLVERLGLEPAGVVLGYTLHSGSVEVAGPAPATGEAPARTGALVAAWTLCLHRLLAQCEDLGADGVLGVDLRFAPAGGERIALSAHGTAVRAVAPGGSWRTDGRGPFATTLSGRDVWLLTRAGYRPLGLVFGASTGPMPDAGRPDQDGEHDPPAQAVYDARERALGRVRAEADALHADGVVALTLDALPAAARAGEVCVVGWGTAVRRLEGHEKAPEPEVVLPLHGAGT
jgi:uncharacterized protein YbjQ (UPF0145 family)